MFEALLELACLKVMSCLCLAVNWHSWLVPEILGWNHFTNQAYPRLTCVCGGSDTHSRLSYETQCLQIGIGQKASGTLDPGSRDFLLQINPLVLSYCSNWNLAPIAQFLILFSPQEQMDQRGYFLNTIIGSNLLTLASNEYVSFHSLLIPASSCDLRSDVINPEPKISSAVWHTPLIRMLRLTWKAE